MIKSLNVAVIGCGILARSKHIPHIAASKRMTLHTCCDLSDAVLAECRDRHDVCNWFMGTQPLQVMSLEGGMLNYGVDSALAATRVSFAAIRSAQTGKALDLESI